MKNFNLIEWLQTDSHGKQSATRDHHGTKSRELPDNPRLYRYPCATLALPLRYVAMIFAVLVMSIGQMWGTNQTYSINTPSQNVYTDATSGITVIGTQTTGKIDNSTGQKIFAAKNQQPLHITSIKANIKGIAFEYDDSSSGSGSEAIMSILTSNGSALAAPTSGYSGTISINGGSSSSIGASLAGLAVGKDQSKHCSISVTFTSALSTIVVNTSSSNAAQIRNLVITYDDAITAPDLYATITPTGSNTYSVTSGKGSMTAASVNATTQTISGSSYYQLNSSTNTYTPAESLAAGDIVVFTMGNTSSKNIGVNIESGGAFAMNKVIASQPYQIVYVVPSTKSTLSFVRNNSDCYLKDIKVYHSEAHSCTDPTASWSTAPADGTAGGNMNASLTTNYAAGVVYTSSNTDVATVSGDGTATCAINYVAAGTARITATVTGDGSTICAGPATCYTDITVSAAGSPWTIRSNYTDNNWSTNRVTMTGTTTVTGTWNITTAGMYEFKVVDTSSDTWYGNTGNIGCNVSGWTFSTGESANCKFFASETGNYTFTFNTSTKALSVTYPTAQGKYYYKNTGSWGAVYVYRFKGGINNGWPGTQVVETETICGDTYYFTYADPGTTLIFDNNSSSQTGDMAASGNAGKYVAGTGSSWNTFPTYTVTYNKNGDGAGGAGSVTGSVPTDSNSPYACGSTVTVLGNTGSLAKDGYNFIGWNTAPGGGGTSYVADATFTISANTTLYAQWELIPTYDITYNANEGTGTTASQTGNLSGAVVATRANGFTRSGYKFKWWNTAANGSGEDFYPGENVTIASSNVALYAQWEQVADNQEFWTPIDEASKVTGVAISKTAGDMSITSGGATDAADINVDVTASACIVNKYNSSVDKHAKVLALKANDKYIEIHFTDGSPINKLWLGATPANTDSKNIVVVYSATSNFTTAGGAAHEFKKVGSTDNLVALPGNTQATKSVTDVSPSTENTYYYARIYRRIATANTVFDNITNLGSGTTVRIYSIKAEKGTLCIAPSALTAATPTAKGITLSVTDANNVNNYEFYVSTSSTAPEAGATATHSVSSAKSLTITNLVAGTTYYAWARSVCGVSNKSGWTALTGSTFTTSTVTMTPTLTNVTHTSGATSGIGGSNYTAVFTANTGYSMPNPTVTIGGNAATSGTDYTWSVDGSVGTITIPANKINGNIAITLNSAKAAPSSVTVDGTWHRFPGETITLTAEVTGGNGPKTYQWYKGEDAIVGAMSATYTKASCAYADAGDYWCTVTCGGTESTSSGVFQVKILRLYVKTGKYNGNAKEDYGNVDFTKVDGSTATASISLGSNWDYCFNIADGCGHAYGYADEITVDDCTDWTINVNNQDCGLRSTNAAYYVFTIDYSEFPDMVLTVTYPTGDQAADKIIYFDNQTVNWSTLHYRVGKTNHTQATAMTKVPGTNNLWKVTTTEYLGFAGWHIANNAGWTGSNSIYRTYTNGDAYSITKATAHDGGAVTQAAVTVTPTTWKDKGGDAGINDNCDFYNYSITSGMKTQNVAISPYSNGTITVNYTNTSNVASTLTSGNADLAHSVILTSITAVPNTGYDASAITINGGAYSANYVVTGATTIAASFTPHTYSITYKDQGDVAFSGTHVDSPNAHPTSHTYATATTLNSATKTGYTFGGWYTTSVCTGDPVTSLGATAYTANITLYAKWTADATLTAISADVLYQAADMANITFTGSDQYWAGLSTNNLFQTYGNGTSNSAKGKTISSTSVTDDISTKNFTSHAYIEGSDVTSGTADPTYGAIEFITPSTAGILYVYTVDGSSSNLKLRKKGTSTFTALTGSSKYNAIAVDASTHYYIHGNSGKRGLYGIQYVSTYAVSFTTTNVTKATGETTAIKGKTYTATFTANTGYTLPSDATVTIGGVPQTKGTGYTWTISDGTATLTVPAAYVTGAISISVTGDEAAPATLYTVTFMSNGGSAVSPVTQASEGASIAKPSDPTRASYSFDGWYKTDGTKVSWPYTPTADITLYARWEEECDDDGTDSSVNDVAASGYTTYQEVGGSNVVFTATPSLGFKYKDADGNIINNSTTAATRNNAYSCQIKSSSSNIGSIKTNSAYSNVDSISFYFAASDKSGCKIAVWCSTDNFSTDSTSLLSATTYGESNSEFKLKTLAIPSGKKASSLQFKFRFTVTGSGKTCYMDSLKIYSSTASSGTCYHVYYHGNGAESGFVSDTTSYADGAKAVVLSYHDSRYPLTKEGYDFQGWATSAGGSAEYSDGQQITIDGADVHLYAKWAPASSALVTWTMNTNTGTWGASATSTTDGTNIGSIATARTAGGSESYTGATAKVTMADAEVTGSAAPSNSANFTFTIKSSTKQVEISKFDCKVFNVSSGDRTYKAQISDEAGNVYNSTNTVAVSTAATLTDASFVFGTGKILRGDVTIRIYAWKTSGSPTEFRMGPDVKFYGTVQDYACATPSAPTISGASEYAVGQTITLTASHEGDNYDNLTTYTWYRGADWATASAASPVQAAAAGAAGYTLTKTAVAADDDLFWCKVSNGTCDAHNSIGYNVNVYAANTITWNLNGGSWGAVEHKDSYSRFDDDYTLPVPTRDGYVFAGWYEVSDFSGVAIEILESGSVGDREYWAKWGSEVTVSWSVTKVDSKLYRGGGGYSVTAVVDQADWDGSPNNGDKDELVLTATEGVTLKNIVKSINGSGKAQVTADFDITTDLDADATEITFTLSVPATESYGPAEIPHNEDLTSCAGSGYTEFFSMTPIANTCSITNTQAYNKSNHYTTCDCTSSATITTGGSATFGLYSSGSGTTDKYWEYSSTNGSKHSIANTWVVLYSTTQFVAGDSIVITNGNASSSGYYTIVAAASDNTADYHSASQVTAPSTTNPAKNTNYYYILPKSFVSSNYLVIRSSTSSSCYFKAIKAYHAASSGGVTPTLTWDDGAEDIATTGVEKSTSNDDFVYTASQDKNSLGAITYSSDNTSVATVNATTGQVHLAGEAGTATITATIAASGCFGENSISYTVTVEDDCDDVAGTIETEDLGCAGIKMTVTGHTAAAGVSYQWYKAGSPDETVGTNQDNYTTTAAGSYYVIVTNSGDRHCAKRSTNTVTVEAQAAATATKIVDSWYVKNGRRTPDIELVETTNAESFTVTNKGTSTVIWNSDGTVTTGFGGCDFRMGEDGIIYLNGTKANGDAPTGLTGATDVELRITAIGCGSSSYQDITIHCQAETTRPSIAFVVDGTKGGAWDAVTSGHASGTDLYDYLNYNSSTNPTGAFDLTERNVYKTTNEKDIREHYSQFDAILITDDPSTDTKDGSGKSYVNAFGTMVDIRPILTMEAYVSKWPNWKAKGIAGSPSSPNPRQYEIRLECKDHEIYKEGLPDPEDGTNVWDEMIGGETFRHVILVDSTKGIYNGVAYNVETAGDQKPALQGFTGEAAGSLLGLGRILEGTLQAAIERQEEPAARLLVMGINAKALRPTSALTNEGKIILRNILHYLLKTNMEEVDDCSNYFTGATDDDWSNTSNWSKGGLPSSEAKVRILAPCVISGSQPHVAQVAIVNSGKSSIRQTATGSADCNGKLTIEATGALIVDGIVRTAVAPHFAYNDLMPTTPSDLTIGAAPTGSGTLIFDNSDGDTQASVQMYSKGSIIDGEKNYQYIGIPFDEVNALYNYYGSWLYSWSYKDSGYGWVKVPKGGTVYAWTGYCITQESQMTYAPEGTLAATGTVDIEVPADENMVVGNSWTAPIDINAFEDDDFENLTGNVYFFNTGVDKTGEGTTTANATGDTRWAAGTYVSVPIHAAPYSGDDHIPSMQGFFVKNESGSAGTLHLDYDRHVRGTTRDNYLSGQMHAPRRTRAVDTDKPVVVTIKVSGENYDDRLVLLAREDFSEGFDNGWDGDKWDGNESALYLYSPDSEGTENSVSAVPELEGTVIGFRAGEDDEYTMYFDYLNGDEKLYLWDTETGDYTVIKTGYAYAFTTADKEKHARFVITRSDQQDVSTDITSTSSQGEGVKAKKLLIGNKMYIMVDGRLYDATGKIVK